MSNDERVPSHYKADYIHWDFVLDTGMDYLAGNATKYISRWRDKGGVADLQKAVHYIDKLLENVPLVGSRRNFAAIDKIAEELVAKFCIHNNITSQLEYDAILLLVAWETYGELEEARSNIKKLIYNVIPLEDSNKHALQDEDPLGR